MNDWEVFGHDWAVEMLQKHAASGATRHAYLLTGPSGVGRRTLALRLAQALNCETPASAGVPCRTCRSCKQIETMQNPDLLVIQAESVGGTLKVDQVREVQRFLSFKPYLLAYKVVLFLRFEEANANAQNALLKTLEEAPAHGVLILTADNAEQLLPTVVSRCEILRLRSVAVPDVELFLQARGVEAEKATLLASLSGGSPGVALKLNVDEKALAFRSEKLTDLISLLAAKRRERFAYAEKLAKDKEAFRQALLLWLGLWRDVLLQAGGSSAHLVNVDFEAEINRLGAEFDLQSVRRLVQATEQALERLEKNVNPRLLAETFLMTWPKIRN